MLLKSVISDSFFEYSASRRRGLKRQAKIASRVDRLKEHGVIGFFTYKQTFWFLYFSSSNLLVLNTLYKMYANKRKTIEKLYIQ